MNHVELRNISYHYSGNRTNILDDFSLTVHQGEIVGILGPSGCGKSTLLRLISGLESPATGEIRLAGKTVSGPAAFVQPEKRGVGMVFQDYALFPHLTVRKNIEFGLNKLAGNERVQRVSEMLQLFSLTQLEKRYPHELSGGQQQRVAFARALAPKPNVLLMDEPFSNLDAGLKASIRQELSRILRSAGMTGLLVTHDREDAAALCDRTVLLGNNTEEQAFSLRKSV